MSKVPVVWAILDFFRRDTNDFLSRLMTMDETWLYHYDPEIKQQLMEWLHSGSPRPKKFQVQISSGKVLASIFFWDQDGTSSLIIFKRAKLSTRSITHLCWYNWRTFWRKNAVERSPSGSCPGSPGTCNPEETGLPRLPTSWSPTLFSRSGPVGLPPVPWTEKKNCNIAIFRPTRRSLLPRRPGWTDNLLNFFWVACKG